MVGSSELSVHHPGIASDVQAFSANHSPLLFNPLADIKCPPIHSDPGKEIGPAGSFIDPFVDFVFVGPAQLPDLVFDLLGIHDSLSCNYRIYTTYRRNSPILFSIRYGCFCVGQVKIVVFGFSSLIKAVCERHTIC